jgi:subtilisin family serine protease
MTVTSIRGTPLGPAIEYAWTRGAVTVLAAGNYEEGVTGLSPNYGDLHAVVVGATDESGAVTDYSTDLGNAAWGLVAPGGIGDGLGDDILTTAPGGRYWSVAGTSFAAPHVSGTLALLLSEGLTPQAAVDRLLGTLDHSTPCGNGCRGRLRAGAAATPPPPAAPVDTVAPAPPTPADSGLDPAIIGLAVAAVAVLAAVGIGFGVTRRKSSAHTQPWTSSASADDHRSAA